MVTGNLIRWVACVLLMTFYPILSDCVNFELATRCISSIHQRPWNQTFGLFDSLFSVLVFWTASLLIRLNVWDFLWSASGLMFDSGCVLSGKPAWSTVLHLQCLCHAVLYKHNSRAPMRDKLTHFHKYTADLGISLGAVTRNIISFINLSCSLKEQCGILGDIRHATQSKTRWSILLRLVAYSTKTGRGQWFCNCLASRSDWRRGKVRWGWISHSSSMFSAAQSKLKLKVCAVIPMCNCVEITKTHSRHTILVSNPSPLLR